MMLLLTLALVSVFANAEDATTQTPVADATTKTPVATEAPPQILTIEQLKYSEDQTCSGTPVKDPIRKEVEIGACVASGFAPAVSSKFTCSRDNVVKETQYTQANCAGVETTKFYLLNSCGFTGMTDGGTKVENTKYTFSGACLKETGPKSLVKITEAEAPLSVGMVILMVVIFSAICTAFCCFVAYCGQPADKNPPQYGQMHGQSVTVETADGKNVEAVLR